MRVFVSRGTHLGRLSIPAKLVYTIFLAFIIVGALSSYLLYAARIGASLRGPAPSVAARYVDSAAPAAAPEAATAPGPALDLPPEPSGEAARAAAAPSDAKWPFVLDVFHQHLFSVSVVFLIVAHLFMLTRLAGWLSGTVIVIAGLSALAHVLAPVLIHLTGGLLWLMPWTGGLMGASWAAMIVWSLGAMWLGWGLANGD
ncbi:MAG: hypothetical protein KC543_00260 [Myxococcales bacterium]|nr:hypothetical protein [Myxococcales bacterium]